MTGAGRAKRERGVSVPARELALEHLTRVERLVARDAARGLSTAEIARRRKRSPRTIANQLASIYRKLGIASRAELAVHLHGRRR